MHLTSQPHSAETEEQRTEATLWHTCGTVNSQSQLTLLNELQTADQLSAVA